MTKVKRTNQLGKVKSVDRYIRLLREKIFESGCGLNAQVFFRGEPCECQPLRPSLFRKKKPRYQEAAMLERLEMMEPEAFAAKPATIDRLVMARHHGLPTRLLDVTRDPLVALFFASQKSIDCRHKQCHGKIHAFLVSNGDRKTVKSANSDTVSMLAAFAMLRPCEQQELLGLCEDRLKSRWDAKICKEDGKDAPAVKRLHHFIAREKPYFDVRFKAIDFFRVVIVEPRRTFPRLRAQSGAVMLSARHERFGASDVREELEGVKNGAEVKLPYQEHPEPWAPYKHKVIDVPSKRKCEIRKQLLWLNVNEYTIMTGLDAAATEVERWANARD